MRTRGSVATAEAAVDGLESGETADGSEGATLGCDTLGWIGSGARATGAATAAALGLPGSCRSIFSTAEADQIDGDKTTNM